MDQYNNYGQPMYEMPHQTITKSGVIAKSLIGLLIVAAITFTYFVTGFSISMNQPFIGFSILLILVWFVAPFCANKTRTTAGITQVLFWLGNIVIEGVFLGECCNSLLAYGIIATNGAMLKSLGSIIGLALLIVISLALAGIALIPMLLKHFEASLKYGTIILRLVIFTSTFMIAFFLIGLVLSFFGMPGLLNIYYDAVLGFNPVAIGISLLFVVFSFVLYLRALMQVAEMKNADKGEEYFASILIISCLTDIFYYVLRLIILIFGANSDD